MRIICRNTLVEIYCIVPSLIKLIKYMYMHIICRNTRVEIYTAFSRHYVMHYLPQHSSGDILHCAVFMYMCVSAATLERRYTHCIVFYGGGGKIKDINC